MDCIYCSGSTQVVNSRPQKRLQQVWRRRSCKSCKAIFTTLEGVELSRSLLVHYPDGHRAPFSRDALYFSIVSAMGHRNDAVDASTALTATVIAAIRKSAKTAVIERNTIVEECLRILQRFDNPAGVQYAAYHPL